MPRRLTAEQLLDAQHQFAGVSAEFAAGRMRALVFVPAFARSALDACAVHALDYLLKPFDAPRLVRAVTRAESLGMSERANEVLAPLIAKVRTDRPLSDKLPAASPYLLAPVAELTHVVAEAGAPDDLLDPYRALGVTVTRA